MKRDIKEIIKRNREALGMNGSSSDVFTEMIAVALVGANNVVSIETFSNPNHIPIFLADGLIVGYEV